MEEKTLNLQEFCEAYVRQLPWPVLLETDWYMQYLSATADGYIMHKTKKPDNITTLMYAMLNANEAYVKETLKKDMMERVACAILESDC